jgi:hypothetical protein
MLTSQQKSAIAGSFIVSMYTGVLPSGKRAKLTKIGQQLFDKWHIRNPALAALPAIGSSAGPTPDTINDRIMYSLGGTGWLEPFLLLEEAVNMAKGKLFMGNMPVREKVIQDLTTKFIRADTRAAADKLLTVHRKVS